MRARRWGTARSCTPNLGFCARQELEQRYGEFRVAVQSALDAGEAVGYREIVQRLGRRDRRVAHAALNPISLRSGGGGAAGAGVDGASGCVSGAELASKGGKCSQWMMRWRNFKCMGQHCLYCEQVALDPTTCAAMQLARPCQERRIEGAAAGAWSPALNRVECFLVYVVLIAGRSCPPRRSAGNGACVHECGSEEMVRD